MPFIQRQVAPVFLARLSRGNDQEIDSLAETQIRVLNGIIEQLSDISDHATDIIDNIKVDCDAINQRAEKVIERLSQVSRKVSEMKTDEKVTNVLEDQGRADEDMEGQFFTPDNRPHTILQLYVRAAPMPDLDILQPFRDDEVECRHVYSHPGYFFELWKAQFEEAARKEKEKRREERKLRKKNRIKTPGRKKIENLTKIQTQVERQRMAAMAAGHHIKSYHPIPQISVDMIDRPPSEIIAKSRSISVQDSDLPPVIDMTPSSPPPAPLPLSSPPPCQSPPPPTPAPPAAPTAPMPPPPPMPTTGSKDLGSNLSSSLKTVQLSPVPSKKSTATVDTRSDLLKQIKEKRNLKKVQRRQSLTVTSKKPGIAGIFEKALEDIQQAKGYSDDEDDDDSDNWSDSD